MVRLPCLVGVLGLLLLTACGASSRSESPGVKNLDACEVHALLGVGSNHACAVTATGEVACWGAGYGNGTNENQATPVLVPGLTDAIAVSAGSSHSCALRKTRDVVCWGTNAMGQLGDGTTEDRLEPAPVSNLGAVRSVSAGGEHTCAVLESGEVACWGANEYGEVGLGEVAVRTLPTVVAGVSQIRAISAGGRNTCALLDSGEVSCWGWQWKNMVGVSGPDPVLLPGIASAVQVSAGLNHDCLVLETGEAACRGYGRQGQLGDGENGTQDDPRPVLNLADATRIAAGLGGYGHTCAVRQTGAVVCWGIHTSGQLGNSTSETVQTSPGEPVLNLSDAIALGAGAEHSCALQRTGTITCWGKGDSGQLGDGSSTNQGMVAVSGLLAATCP
jgi:alpha-tubulin suppressor-like RCC1 family protein